MKKLLIFLFLLTGLQRIEAKVLQSDTVIVNKSVFLFVKFTQDGMIGTVDTILKVYRIENGQRKYLLTHNIHIEDADCNSYFIDYGTYEVKGDSIIFKTEFSVERDKNFGLPYRQKQIYHVKADGKMVLVYDRSEMEDGIWKNNLEY